MNKNDDAPAGAGATACSAMTGPMQDAQRVRFEADGSVAVAALEEGVEWLLALAEQANTKVAKSAHRAGCLRAARGGSSHVSHNSRRNLVHPRMKAGILDNDHFALLTRIADTQEELAPLLVASVEKVLELDLYKADLQRCEDAMQRQRQDRAEIKLSGIYPEAREVVARLAVRGIREGHWSTVTSGTIEKIAALILADSAEAGFGSPDNPKVEPMRARKSR